MKRYAVGLLLVAIGIIGAPCNAQLLQNLERNLMGGGQGQQQQQQGMMPGQQVQPTVIGNVNLPPGQYLMTNVQSGQAFYVMVQNGQMYLSGQPGVQQTFAPGQGPMSQQGMMPQQQQGGVGGLIKGGFGSFLKNELAPKQQVPDQ